VVTTWPAVNLADSLLQSVGTDYLLADELDIKAISDFLSYDIEKIRITKLKKY